jgi:hypothetical protein
MPALEYLPMSTRGLPNACSNAHVQLRAPAPPVSINVPSMSNRISFSDAIAAFSLAATLGAF